MKERQREVSERESVSLWDDTGKGRDCIILREQGRRRDGSLSLLVT